MTLEDRVELLQEEVKQAEADLDRKYKQLAVARAELERQRHDAIHPHIVTTASD